MRKLVVLGLLLVLVSSLSWGLPASAQDETVPPCTQAEIDDTLAALGEIMQSYSDMGTMAMDDAASLTGAIAGFEALSTGYWDEVYPEIPFCVELVELSFGVGLLLDDSLNLAIVARLALYADAAGDAELANEYADIAQTRADGLAADVDAYFTPLANGDFNPMLDLPICSADNLQVSAEVLNVLADGVAEIDAMSAEIDSTNTDEVTPFVLAVEAISSGYWTDVFPEFSECSPAFETAFRTGVRFDDALSAIGLWQVSNFERDAGNMDSADYLAEAADARLQAVDAELNEFYMNFGSDE